MKPYKTELLELVIPPVRDGHAVYPIWLFSNDPRDDGMLEDQGKMERSRTP
jgi:hypothetical protein